MNLPLGIDRATGRKFRIPKKSFNTHWHLIGATGKGKTTAIHTLLHPLLLDPTANDCWIILDRMGNFSTELLLWMSSDFCTDDVRRRLLYVEAANENVVLGFNPLLHETQGEGYYKVQRGVEAILRGWVSQNIQEMPRLAMWTHNAFWAAAQLGLTISDCAHFLMPGSQYHKPLLRCLPDRLQYEWLQILESRSGEAIRLLESTRNRLRPYFEQVILRRMFGSTQNRLDVRRMMREGRIVIVNLASQGRIDAQSADAIGGLILNEVLAVARSMKPTERTPTYLLLDEFQRFVGSDMEEALPEVRQLQVRLILAHQSFSQLKRGDHDLTNMIFQAQSRMIFGLQGEDADLLAHELASMTFDPKRIKEELFALRQRQEGHRKVLLSSWQQTVSESKNWNEQIGRQLSKQESRSGKLLEHGLNPDISRAQGSSDSSRQGKGGGTAEGHGSGQAEHLVPILTDYNELTTRSYYSFDEMMRCWGRDVRNRTTGECYVRLVDDKTVYDIKVQRSTPGFLGWDAAMLQDELPEVIDAKDRLIEENFRSDFFVTPQVIEREEEERLGRVLGQSITIQSSSPPQPLPLAPPSPFFGD